MRIALVIPRFDPRIGGAERWTWDHAARLLRHGHGVHVVAEAFAEGHGPIVRHPVPRVSWGGSRRRLAFAAGAERVLRGLGCDIIHDMGHGWYADVFMPHGGTRGGSFRQNLLLSPPSLRWAKRVAASLLPRYRTFRELERRQYATDGSRRFLAISEMVRRDMVLYHGVPHELVRVVYNGADVRRFTPAQRDEHRVAVRRRLGIGDEVLFLLIAHNFRLKGVRQAIEATARLARDRRDVRLLVVGSGRTAPHRRLASRLGCGSCVHWGGSASEVIPFYAAADVYLHPTFYDPCSLVVLEALASGLPVITTAHNGAGELLTPGAEGFVVAEPTDIAALSEAMRKLLDRDLRAACGQRARLLAERHDVERNYRDMVAVYEESRAAHPPERLGHRRASA